MTKDFIHEFSGEHLAYEVEMFFATVAELAVTNKTHTLNVQNALLESFVIHARAILFFFYDEKPKPDDAIAQHFMAENKDWSHLRPTLTDTLLDLQKRVGKEIAHLTYTRATISPRSKGWTYPQIVLDLLNVFWKFLEHADSSCLHPHFSEVVNFWSGTLIRNGILSIEK